MALSLQSVTNVTPNQSYAALGTGTTTLISNSSASQFKKINSIIVSNVDGTNDVDINVWILVSGSNTVYIAKTVTVPADSTLIVLTKDTPLYLQDTSSLQASASASGDAQIIVQYDECY
jgi:hypothetical protein